MNIRHAVAVLAFCLLYSPALLANSTFIALCYHDVKDDIRHTLSQETMGMSTEQLIAQFNWLKGNGYTPVSLDDIIAANQGVKSLPEKAVLLTFDDGYQGMYQRVYPLLKLFNYPAIFGLVGKWLEDVPEIQYGDFGMPRDAFLSWAQIQEMADSGLVEFASHSFDLHKGIVANPQGNVQPAAVILAYDLETQQYENDEQYIRRLRDDLSRNSELLKKHLGKAPRTMVWPYGEHTQAAIDVAAELGMKYNLVLDDKESSVNDLSKIKRILVGHDMDLSDFAWLVNYKHRELPIRAAHVDLDYVYDDNKTQQGKNLDSLLDRIKALKINTVYLQAYADPDGNGVAEALYFPNRHLPMRADLFNRVAWQLRTRAGVNVYAWMPVMAFKPSADDDSMVRVKSLSAKDNSNYFRLSVFDEFNRQFILDIFEDLAKYTMFAGLLFHDDGFLTDFEDASGPALRQYQAWGLPNDVNAIRSSPELLQRWTQLKTQYLIEWTTDIADHVRQFRPQIKTARNIYARLITDPNSEQWFAQSLTSFVENYDYTAVMAMPYMELAEHPLKWLRSLIKDARTMAGNTNKLVFELQSKDWWKQRSLTDVEMNQQILTLQQQGAVHYGYYPDDFIMHRPSIDAIYPLMSLNRLPEFN